MEKLMENVLQGSRILITGGAGLVGSHIADLLVREKAAEIIVLDNFSRGRIENLSHAIENGNVTIIEGDICDRKLVEIKLKGIDYIFHQAAIRITRCASEPRLALETLIDGTYNIIESAVNHKIKKVVFASSASVYGMAGDFPTEEDHHPYNNRTFYGGAKVAGEQMFRAFNEMYGLKYIALRYFNIYGPRMDVFGVFTEVLVRWLDLIDKGESPIIFGDGNQTMDFVYIGDIARANILAMKSNVDDEVFNIASGTETSLNELLNVLLEVTGSNVKPVFKEERKVNPVARRIASIRKAQNLLNFKTEIDLKEGLTRLVEWRKEIINSGK